MAAAAPSRLPLADADPASNGGGAGPPGAASPLQLGRGSSNPAAAHRRPPHIGQRHLASHGRGPRWQRSLLPRERRPPAEVHLVPRRRYLRLARGPWPCWRWPGSQRRRAVAAWLHRIAVAELAAPTPDQR
jgi:hypothetical protein